MKKSYFTVSELCYSDVARKNGIINTPGIKEMHNLEKITIPHMNIIRKFLDCPIVVNSGFRCQELNRKVKGVYNSKHLEGLALDGTPIGISVIEAWEKLKNSKYASLLDQCILYRKKNFIHFGFCDNTPRQQFFEK